ncbi:hypothetical protein CHARACLAT_010690 [Characodon lateralis]|uniref:Uncharacterized protein n=1 Tax=Characodon lateralis TaxID=208331 RepID=A0ABU7DJA1_9TELE|nr:hypothetical protein [Characodon lateralis]
MDKGFVTTTHLFISTIFQKSLSSNTDMWSKLDLRRLMCGCGYKATVKMLNCQEHSKKKRKQCINFT